MNTGYRCVRSWIAAVCAAALAACQSITPSAQPGAPGSPNAQNAGAGLDPIPACATDTITHLQTGLSVHYSGSNPKDPDLCVVEWQKRPHRLYFGFWSDDPSDTVTD